MKSEGAKTPPLPPEEIVNDVARILPKHSTTISPKASLPSIAIWIQP